MALALGVLARDGNGSVGHGSLVTTSDPWPIDPWWWNNCAVTCNSFVLVDIKKLLNHTISPSWRLNFNLRFFALKTERVVQYHHGTPPLSLVCRGNGHGSWSRQMTHFHLWFWPWLEPPLVSYHAWLSHFHSRKGPERDEVDLFDEQNEHKAQYTPPTPTRRNCFVASRRRRRRCVHEFATTADGFERTTQPSAASLLLILQPMGHDCRLVCSHRRHDETVAN